MFILYTDQKGGEWIPFNTPLSIDEIRHDFWTPKDKGMIDEEERLYIPATDSLPTFHSILLPTAARWDATNRQWSYYICGDGFKNWWEHYIANYKPGEESRERKYWWLDQAPGWSLHGVRGVRYQAPADDSVFSSRQESDRRRDPDGPLEEGWEEKWEMAFDWQGHTPKAHRVKP